MAPQVVNTPRDPAHRVGGTVDTFIVRKDRPGVLPSEAPHGCYEGWVYLGHIEYEDESGEVVEVIERVACRRCKAESL